MNCSRCMNNIEIGKVRCPSCGHWNFKETNDISSSNADDSVLLSNVQESSQVRLQSGPWDEYCLNGGLVNTSVTLFGATAGAGKSTLCMQMVDRFCDQTGSEALYISAEQANGELRSLSKRMRLENEDKIRIYSAMGVDDIAETMGKIERLIEETYPCAIVIDSLPGLVLHNAHSSVELCQWAKQLAVSYEAPIIIIDHVTKKDDFAGVMRLRHEVDTLLAMTLRKKDGPRTLTTVKNRNGPAPVSMKLLMRECGMIASEEQPNSKPVFDSSPLAKFK
jgi:predicted ATP-dependent serine protease